jgi:hypothetical protein
MENKEQDFMTLLASLMQEGGFAVYQMYTTDPNDPEGVVEALALSRDVDAMQRLALGVLTTKTKA